MLNRRVGAFRSFAEHEVGYLVIGGIAAVLHGVRRAAFDLDLLVEPTTANAKRLLQALLDAGMATASASPPPRRSSSTRSPCSTTGPASTC